MLQVQLTMDHDVFAVFERDEIAEYSGRVYEGMILGAVELDNGPRVGYEQTASSAVVVLAVLVIFVPAEFDEPNHA